MTDPNPFRPRAGTPRPYHFPHFERQRLPNGLHVWVVPLPERAMVTVHLLADAGAAAEDEARAGVATLTAQALLTGSGNLDANDFAEATEREGIEMGTDSSWDSARCSFRALAAKLERGMELLVNMARRPRFDEAEFHRLRDERLADIRQARSEPGRLADEHFLRQCYAPDSPYARLGAGIPETVAAIEADHVRAHHQRNWCPDRSHLVVAGPVTPEAVLQLAERHLAGWEGHAAGHRPIPVADRGGRRVVVVDRPASVQSELRIGHVGIERESPRYFEAVVMAALLGGFFGCRLNRRLREELGYTYGARASFDPRRSAGPLLARAAVHTEVTADAVRETLAIMEGMRQAPPERAELQEVKNLIIGIFPLRFETTGGVAAGLEPVAVYGLAADYWATYRAHIDGVGPAEVHAAARDFLRPDAALVLLTGDAAKVRGPLEDANLGPVEVVAGD